VVIAWLQPGDADGGRPRPTRAWLPLAVVPLLALVWTTLVSAGTDQLITKVGSNNVGFSEANTTCEHYTAQKRVGFGFGGAIRVGAEVCWNGQQAFVVGDPSLTPPGANLPQEATPYLRDVFGCAPFATDTDFARVSQRCTERIDADGTMTLTVSGVVSPAGGLGQRHLRIELVVDRNGKVLTFG
jgi:hypothetical protein